MPPAPRPPPEYRYTVDRDDRIVEVDAPWLAFAEENGASQLTRDAIVGRVLWDFIADDSTRDTYQAVHRRLRAGSGPIVLPFRCDSPLVMRSMRMTISAATKGQLNYRCVLVRALPTPLNRLLETSGRRDPVFLTTCSCCKRALIEPQGWLEMSAALERMHGPRGKTWRPHMRYTLCERCRDRAGGSPDVHESSHRAR